MCGGFTCSKNSLIALNILYVLVAITLISVAGYAKLASVVSSSSLVSAVSACGVFLLLISLVGILGACYHHQVLLFFYMVTLFIIFIIQFSVACACLAVNVDQQHQIASQGWFYAQDSLKKEAQKHFHCCGYDEPGNGSMEAIECVDHENKPVFNTAGIPCCTGEDQFCCANKSTSANCACEPCKTFIWETINNGLSTVGGIGLFFSFTEFIGVWLTVRFRNQRDPKANPSAFL